MVGIIFKNSIKKAKTVFGWNCYADKSNIKPLGKYAKKVTNKFE